MRSADKAKKVMKITSLALAAVMMIMVFSGCGTVKVDIADAAKKLATEVEYYEKLEYADEDMISFLLMLTDNFDGTKIEMYAGSGASADVVAVTESETKEEADKMNSALQKYMDTQEKMYASYMPKEADKIGKSILTQKGNYNIVCITDDIDTANNVIKTLFGK